MHRRSVRTLVTLLIALGLLCACAAPAPTPLPPTPTPLPPTPTPTPALPAVAPAGSFPMTGTDDLGRPFNLEAAAQRVVSLAPNLTEILFAIGAGDQVVGVTTFCNYPPEAATRPQVGGFTSDTIAIEKIVALEPDLVLATGGFQLETVEALDQLGIAVLALDPNTLDGVAGAIAAIGWATGHGDEAIALVEQMAIRIDAVEAAVADIPAEERLSVYWQIWDEPLMAAGPKSFPGELITLAGGVNIFEDTGDFYPTVSAEEVVARNPQVIMGPNTAGDALTIDTLQQRPGWGSLDAVQNGRIHVIDDDLISRAGPRLVDALEEIAAALYPDRFAE
jgi:iron complex transport system substrate-binding protein